MLRLELSFSSEFFSLDSVETCHLEAMDCHRLMENVGEVIWDFMGDVAEEDAVEATEPSLDLLELQVY